MGPRLDESIEQELGLRFVDVTDDDLSDLDHNFACATSILGKDPENLMPPEQLLAQELTPHQRTEINRLLGPEYAKENSQQQKQLQQQIPIRESGERMVSVRDTLAKAGVDVSYTDTRFHDACGKFAGQQRIWHARQQVVEKLIPVFRTFNMIGIRPHLEDCFRPPAVQEGLLLRRLASLAQKHKDWDPCDVQMVGMSLTAPVPGLAGHQAGAALDLRLQDKRGKFLKLGNEYAESGAVCCINCPYVTLEQYKTRMLFAQIMRMGDFRLLRTENWHVSYGDRGLGIDGPLNIREAIYGPIQNFNRRTGKIVPYESDIIDQPYLSSKEVRGLVEISRDYEPTEDEYVLNQVEAVAKFRKWLSRRRGRLGREKVSLADEPALEKECE